MPTPKPYAAKDGSTTWRVRFRDTSNRSRSRTFFTEKDAQWFSDQIEKRGVAFALRSLDQLEQDERPDDTPALSVVFEEFVTWKADYVRSDRTTVDYRAQFADAIQPQLGSYPIGSITPDDIAEWVEAMVSGKLKSSRTKKRYSPKTIRGRHALLHSIFKYAANPRRGYIDTDPCAGVTLPKRIRATPKGLMPAEWQALEIALRAITPDAADLAAFLIGSGWRWGEATALTPAGVEDYGPGLPMYVTMMQVNRRDGKGAYHLTVGEGKAQKSMRRIKLDGETAAIVRAHMVGLKPNDPVFSCDGEPWTHSMFQWRFKRAAENANLARKPTPHWLRHTHVAWMAMAGAPLPELQARIGHASIQTTIGVYGSMISDVQDGTLDAFALMRGTAPKQLPPATQALIDDAVDRALDVPRIEH